MDMYFSAVESLSGQYHRNRQSGKEAGRKGLPGGVFFAGGKLFSVPRDDGDCRYPFGSGGINFWAHGSGYLHCNDGLFSIFQKASEGQEPKIAFFAGFPQQGDASGFEVLPLLPVPDFQADRFRPAERYTVFSGACAYYITEWSGLRFSVRVFPDRSNVLHFTVGIENRSGGDARLFVSSYFNPFLKHALFESSEDRWFREVRCLPGEEEQPGLFLVKVNEDVSRTESISNYGVLTRNMVSGGGTAVLDREETTSRYDYVGGGRGSLHRPAALLSGHFPGSRRVCAFTETGAAGDIIHLAVPAGGTFRYELEFRYKAFCRNEEELGALLRASGSRAAEPGETDRMLEAMEREEERATGAFRAAFLPNAGKRGEEGKVNGSAPDGEVLGEFFRHLMKQVKFCALIKGYVHLSALSMIGFRDIFQALEALLFWDPGAAGDKMLEALDFVLADGRCPRQYTLPTVAGQPSAMDLRPFVDQGSWVVTAVSRYLKFTGDRGFLDRRCGYCEIVDGGGSFARDSGFRGSVLDHLLRITDYLLEQRDHGYTGCVRALYGDWNDALDGLGVSGDPGVPFGTGVSVMASLQVYQNLSEMLEILEWTGNAAYLPKMDRYRSAREELAASLEKYAVVGGEAGERRILHGWGDKRSYLVGSFEDPDKESRYSLTSNTFWVLSSLYDRDPSIRDTVLEAFKKLDSKYGYKTFEPHFAKNTPGVGRIPKLPAGTAENGAVYIHASTFAVMALFCMGEPRKAWEQLGKLLPFTHERISCSPFVMPNSYGCNEELGIDGESMHDWQTGSSNVIFKIFARYVFGIEPGFDGLWLQPAGWSPFPEMKLEIEIRRCRVALEYQYLGGGPLSFLVDGVPGKTEYCGSTGQNRLFLPWDSLGRPGLHIRIQGQRPYGLQL
jgi:hypothetical protein